MRGIYLCNFIVPLVMLYLSYHFKKEPCKQIGSNGYSTPASRKSQEAWDYAQQICPAVFGKIGEVLLGVELIMTIIFIAMGVNIGAGLTIGEIVGVVGLGLAFYRVENQLEKL
ncbi:MAG: SdpI family protein [Clostridium sp.]|nr:SdpI family protein [Clostridium sp.]